MSSRHPARPFFLIGSFEILAAVCLLAGCTATHIVITASPSTAELEVSESVTITAVVTGTNNSEDREVVWSVCDGQGENCVTGGNSSVGTVAPFMSGPSSGNPTVVYTAPSSVPSPPDCLSTSDGCAVVVRGKLARFEAACFTTITLHEPPNPVPVLVSLTPDEATEGEPAFTLGVTGSNFILSSVVRWDGSDRTTTFLSDTQLEAGITATDIAAAGTASVTVFNPAPGGGTSNALTFTIAPAVPCVLGVTERASVATDGSEGNDDSGESGAVSADGRFVAFASAASNLVSGDTNGVPDVFVRDTCRGAVGCSPSTVRVSVASDGTQGNITSGNASSLSADGRFVAFSSFASNLVTGDTNGGDIFVHDRDTDTDGIFDEPGFIATVRVSVASDGSQANAESFSVLLSADGRFVAFNSFASNLVSGDTNATGDVFVHDRDTDNDGIFDEAGAIATVRVSVASDGTQGNSFSGQDSNAISADGRFVAFASFASNLVSGDTNDAPDVFVHDRDTDQDGIFDESGAIATVRVSVASDGTQGNIESRAAAISATGRFVAFTSFATNLVSGDTNATRDIFVHDRDTDTDGIFDEAGAIATVRVSVASDGTEANNRSAIPSMSANGRIVAFASSATNLVSGDANARWDVFVHDRDTENDGIFDEAGAIATVRVSVASDGTEGNADSGLIDDFAESLSLSADGRFAAFISAASNLVTGDTNGQADVFVAQTCFP